LKSCSVQITGDFLNYWKQRVRGSQNVQLLVRHHRDEDGNSQLAFYVHDRFDQYPEQRSKGFVWFLSFYLRLAAAYKRESREQETRVLLIDEPGTYLHARAQKDVLHLFEDRLAKKDQIVYSTHSPFLLPADRLHRIRIVLKAGQDGTLVLDRLTHPLLRGGGFSDTLSPILMAAGVDFTGTLPQFKDKSLLVEGISDYFYLMAWKRLLGREDWDFAVFPCTGARSVVTFASLMIGLGLRFLALFDRDSEGHDVKEKLENRLGIYPKAIVQPHNASSIEDIFSSDDFRKLLMDFDQELKPETGEMPSACIRRLKINKVLLGRKYTELVFSGKMNTPTQKTQDAANRLLDDIQSAWEDVEKRGSSLEFTPRLTN
jgi:predicted ATP-dependent endonuclease of OLD family